MYTGFNPQNMDDLFSKYLNLTLIWNQAKLFNPLRVKITYIYLVEYYWF